MFNQLGGAPAAPVDLLMGFLGGRPQGKASGAGDFGGLVDLLGSMPLKMPGEGRDSLLSDALPTTQPETAIMENITLLLPANLVQALGIGEQARGDATDVAADTDNSQMMTAVKAELLSTDDGKQQALYLKILPRTTDPETASMISATGDKNEEMVLPMRLRTVEQQGDRIVADAELQTATGEDVSIRLRLEIAGNPTRIGDSKTGSEGFRSGPPKTSTDVSLPRLLHNLDVKSVVIEPMADVVEAGSKDILPRAAILPRNLAGLKPSSNNTSAVNLNAKVLSADEETPWLMPIKTDDKSGGLNDFGQNRMLFDDLNGNGQMASTRGTDAGMTGTTTIPVSEIGQSLPDSEASGEAGQVRFYNIDQKLDQLKQNTGQRIKIQLMPSRLGNMELSISSQRGVVTVNLAVDSIQAKQAVERNLSQLESHLASSGIRVDNFQLHVNQASRSASYSAYQQMYDRGQGDLTGQQGRGFRQYAGDRRRMQQFNPSDGSFRQAMVNCLA